MKTTQVHIKYDRVKKNEVEAFRNLKPDFALVFASMEAMKSETAKNILSDLLQDVESCGCSTSGEITDLGRFDDTIVVQGLKFDQPNSKVVAKIVSDRNMENDYKLAYEAASELVSDDLVGVFLFSPSVDSDVVGIVKGVKEAVGEKVLVAGGLAGDGAQFQKSAVFYNGEMLQSGLALVGLYGDKLSLSHGAFGGWKSFGGVRQVTKAEGSVVYELDGRAALEVYKEALGEHAEKLPSNGLMFPFAILDHSDAETGLIRAVFTTDEENKSIVLAGDVTTGAQIRFMRANNSDLVEGAKKAADSASQGRSDSSLILCISCVARKLVMGEAIDDEIETVRNVISPNSTVFGFYAHGEIGPYFTATDCQIHNQTMTVAVLSEE